MSIRIDTSQPVSKAAAFDALVTEKVRKPVFCTGCGKSRPRDGAARCPDCILEDRRLAAIAKLPSRQEVKVNGEEYEVVFSGADSLSKFRSG